MCPGHHRHGDRAPHFFIRTYHWCLCFLSSIFAVPHYQKGRLTLDKVNSAVDDINNIVEEKYKLLRIPVTKMNELMQRKFKVGAHIVR